MLSQKPTAEDQEFFERPPFPSVFAALMVLAAGDVAIAVSMILSLG